MEALPLSTSDIEQAVKTRMGKEGLAALPPRTIMQCFDETVSKHGNKPALHQKILCKGMSVSNARGWTTWTWSEYRIFVDKFAKALIAVGFMPHDVVNIMGFNSPEWFMANFGAVAAGGVAAGIYTSSTPNDCKYESQKSSAKLVVVDGVSTLAKYEQIHSDLPSLKAMVLYGPEDLPSDIEQMFSIPVYRFNDFLELGSGVTDSELQQRIDEQKPEQITHLIYTAGATGFPKAAMLTNDNVTWTAKAMLETMSGLSPDDCQISYLPLSHISAQMLDMHLPMQSGCQIFFAEADALEHEGSLGTTLKEVRPTLFFGAPPVWEKMHEDIEEYDRKITGVKKTLLTWARECALRYWESDENHSDAQYPAAKNLLRKMHTDLGLDRVKACYTGATHMKVDVLRFFLSIDLPLLEIYGQSESTGPLMVNRPDSFKMGTIGRPLAGTETRLDSEGEYMYRGRNVFAGYKGMPEETKQTIDPEGWVHSGDTMQKCDDGYYNITGTTQEVIVTSKGDTVPPSLIEERFMEAMPALAHCMVVGDKRDFLTVLLCLHVEVTGPSYSSANKMLAGAALATSKQIGSSATTTDEVRECPAWKEYLDNGMAVVNATAACDAQKVSKWSLLSTDFTQKGGELAPTLRVKRNIAEKIHKAEIDDLYA